MSDEGRREFARKRARARKLGKISIVALWVLALVLLGVYLNRGN